MVMFKYERSNLGPTLKLKFKETICMFAMKVYKIISDCKICYDIRPGATIELTDSISNKYFPNSIDTFPNISKYNIYWLYNLISLIFPVSLDVICNKF